MIDSDWTAEAARIRMQKSMERAAWECIKSVLPEVLAAIPPVWRRKPNVYWSMHRSLGRRRDRELE